MLDTMFGALVVRQSTKGEPHSELYDEDNIFVLISELPAGDVGTGKVTLLINGQPLGLVSAKWSENNFGFSY